MAKKVRLGKANQGAKQEVTKAIRNRVEAVNKNKEYQQFLNEVSDLSEQLSQKEIDQIDILNQLEKETEIGNIVKQNQSQEKWYSGITNFFDSFQDRGELRSLWYNKQNGKWYKMKSQNDYDEDNLKEIPFIDVQKLLEDQAQQMASSGSYQTGTGLTNVIEQAFNEGIYGNIVGLGSLITRAVTGNWDDVNDSQIESLWNRTKYYALNALDEIHDFGIKTYKGHGMLYDALFNNSKNISKLYDENEKYFAEKEKDRNIRDAKLNKEYRDIQLAGKTAMKTRFEEEKARRDSGEKLFIDKLYDWSGIKEDNEWLNQQTMLKQAISQRAIEIEGRKKKSFANVEDENIDNSTIDFNGRSFTKEIPGEDGSKSIWDVQKLVIDENGNPVLHEDGNPMYVDKYSWIDKLANSNWNVLTDSYYLQDDFAQGIGTAVGFVIGGKGASAGINTIGKVASKGTNAISNALKLENKTFNYTNKILNATNKITKPFGKSINQIGKTAFNQTINKVNDKVSRVMKTTAQSYFMSNTESEQIGRQVQKKVLNEQIDKHAKIDIQTIANELSQQGNYTSDAMLFLQAQTVADQQRQKWADDNPKLFNEILLQSQFAKEEARGINNINFINNLTSAGLFIKGKSFSRNILNNPFSKQSLKKGAWTITREMAQEGIIEEGIINGFAEKTGEQAGDLKFYDLADFVKNDIGSSEFAENVYAGALLGGLQTSFIKALNLKSEYNAFKNQKKIVNELQQIGSLDTKENIKKVIEYSLDKENNEVIAKKMNDLVSKGKEAEANTLADTLLLNKAVKASISGTTEILNDSFQKLLVNENLTREDKNEIQKAIDFNNKIANIYDAHIQFNNKSSIIENRGNKDLLENYKNEIISTIPLLEEEYNSTLERIIRKEIKNSEYDNDNFNEIYENKKQSIKLDPEKYRSAKELQLAKEQIIKIQEKQDELDDNYDYMVSNKGQKDYQKKINDIRKREIIKSVNKNNVQKVKEDLQEKEELTPETNSNINQTVEEKVVKNNSEVKKPVIKEKPIEEKPNTVKVITEDTKNIPETTKQKAKEFVKISKDNSFDNLQHPDEQYIADNNDALILQPVNLNENDPSHKKTVSNYANVMNEVNQDVSNESNVSLSPKEMFGLFASEVGFDIAEKHFNFFKKAFKQSNIKTDENFNWDGLYDRYFGKLKNFSSEIETIGDVANETAPTIQNIQQQDTKTNSIIQENTTPLGYTQDNNAITYLGRKTASAVNKIPFLGIKYRAVYNKLDDSVTYVDDEQGELNTEGMSNLNIILNPDILIPGKKFKLEIPTDWATRTVSDWKENKNGVLIQQNKIMSQWMEENKIQQGSDAWINKVPMDMIIDGINIGPGVHDVSWWNTRNVADFKNATINNEKLSPEQAIQQQRKVILEGRQLTSNIRKNVVNGNNDMIISEREEGHTLSTNDGQLNSLQVSNPSVKIGIFSPQGFIINKGDSGNEYFNNKIVNENIITDKGHVFMISRIGTEKINNKIIPTYVAHKVHTNHNQESLLELSKSRQRMYQASDILNKLGNYTNPTQEQISWAETIKQQVKLMVGISIDNISSDTNGIKYIGLSKLKQLYPLKAKDNSGLMLLPQLTNINNQKLPIIHEDGSVTNYKSEAGTGYKAMLMDNLYTQKKFHKIQDQQGNDLYVLSIQPRIKFDLVNKKKNIVIKEKKQEIKKVKEKIKSIPNKTLKKDLKIDSITEGQKRRIIEYLFHNILSSIDITKDFTNIDIINKIENSFDNHLSDLKNNDLYKKEYQFLLDNKDSILGINNYDNDINTVKSELSIFLNQEFKREIEEQQLNDEGLFEKNNNKVSFENDVKASLSTKLKMFFAGIPKPNDKVVTEDFADLNSYYSLDEVIGGLQDMLVNIPNNPKAFKNKIENQIQNNPDEFGFLQDILNKFNQASLETQKEILYRLNQTKNDMFFVMYSKSKNGNYTLMVYDANSKNPKIKTKLQYQENLKQSKLVNNYGDTYRIKKDIAKQLVDQYNSWKGKHMEIDNNQYVSWLSKFGIEVSEKTIQDYKDGIVDGHTKFSGNFLNNGGVFGTLFNNLTTAIDRQNKDANIIFKYKPSSKNLKDSFNILTNNNNGFLKTMIDVQVNNTFNLVNSMYVGGKIVNAFSQPNFTTEQLRKIKDTNNPLTDNLKQSAFSKNSLLLKLIENRKIKDAINVGYVSLQSLKQQGQKTYKNSEIIDLSSQDYDLLLQGFFESENTYFKNQELENKGVQIRGVKMTFPTLSDSSQMFIFNTVALDLKKGNFTFDGNNVNINKEVLDIMFDQLVKPDLDRIEAYLKSKGNINIQGFDLGSQLFTMIPSLNSLPIEIDGSKVKLLSKLHTDIKNGNSAEESISNYKSLIYNKLQEIITDNVNSKINIDGNNINGSWVNNGFINENKQVSFLDSKYLNSRGTTDKLEQVQIAAYDFVINYYINQAQIQMLFAGDIANYIKDTNIKKFNTDKYGNPDVTKPKISVDINENQLDKEQKLYIDIIKSTSVNMSKRFKELISPGNRIAESNNEKYIQVMVNDVEESSDVLEELVKTWYPNLYQDNKDDIRKLKQLEKKIKDNIKKDNPVKISQNEYKSLIKSLQFKFPDIKDYFEITATDAQEYTTWQEHLHILLNQGRIKKDIYDSLFNKLKSQSDNGINQQNLLTEDERKIIFQPLKPLHAGLYFEDMKDNEGNIVSKLQRYIYIKTSSFPLLPELTQGIELDNLRINIEKLENKTGKKVRVSYQSGNKVGAVKNAININEMYSDYDFNLESKIIDSSIILNRDNFSIQQDKPFKTDKNIKTNKRDEINRGTQFEKIILGNGINQIEEKIFPNKFDKDLLKTLNITETNNNISGKDLYSIYTYLYGTEQKILRNQLYNSLGLNLNGDWVNNIETLENIKDILNVRLSNQQDKEILELSYIVPEEKNGRIINNYYTKEQVKELDLKPTTAEFNIPIWMSPNSRKFESVLSSIVNNKLVNLKFPGFSSPVASQQGFVYKDETELTNKTGIIFTEKYNGKLKATHNSDGSLKYAQVMVASKFRAKRKDLQTGKYKDELIDLKNYTKKLEDGRVVLNTNKIDSELLQMFSFRIPTSAHQSGALIEIVGFLPHTSGDLMIVPKDHTVQIGEDYDIDTRFVYFQNYRVDSNDNIKKINTEYINKKIHLLDKNFENNVKLDEQIDDILNLFDSIRENEEIQNIFSQDKLTKENKVQILKDKLNHLLIENQLIDIYKSIFSSTNSKIQKMIGATLSTKFAEDTAELIDNKINSKNNNDNFSVFDDRHQKSTLKLGASGKLGIGVHSNWVVLNSLFQQMENKPRLINGYNQKTNKEIPFQMTIGNFTSNGYLGKINALQPNRKKKTFIPRLLSVINMESQNSATDNQKLQIMGRRNENKYTINAFALMSNLGFDKDIVNGKEVSLPSLFISQPIIRRYVELKEQYDSIMSNYQEDVNEAITGQLAKEFGQGIDFVQTDNGLTILKMDSDQMKIVEVSELTGQKLYDSLIKGNNAQQWAVYEKFLELQKHAKNINKVQQLANIDSDGLGISFFNTIAKKDALLFNMTSENLNIHNIENLFGDKQVILNQDQETQNELLNEGYIKVENQNQYTVLVKPTTPLNSKLISSIASGYNLWNNIMPFENEFIDEQITNIVNITNKNPDTKNALELKYKIISDMKDFIYSYSNIGIFDKKDINMERSRLFIDNDTNESLASYLNKLKKSNHKLFNESFFKDLEFTLNKKTEPSLIKYTTNDRANFNKNSVYITFQILNDSKELLPEFNGDKNYTFEKLAKDLTKYSLLSNQENGAIGFRNYIPINIFDKYGVTTSLRRFSGVGKNNSHNLLLNGDFKGLMNIIGAYKINENNTIDINYNVNPNIIKDYVNRINTIYGTSSVIYNEINNNIIINDIELSNFKSVFIKQFFQHNPQEAKKFNWKNNKEWLKESNSTKLEELQWFTAKEEIPEYISIRDSKNSKFFLFEQDNNGIHKRINTLGSFGLNEYFPFNSEFDSLINDNNFKKENLTSTIPINTNLESKTIINDLGIKEGVSKVLENIIESDSRFSEVAKLIKPFVNDIPIKIKNLDNIANGIYIPKKVGSEYANTKIGSLKRGSIYISQELFEKGNKDKIQYAIMEEIVHSITVDEVDKYVNTQESYINEKGEIDIIYKTDNPPSYIIKLVSLFKDGSKHILNKYSKDSTLEEAINTINQQKAIWNNDIENELYTSDNNVSNELKVDTYRTLNLGEFIAGVMLSEKFRNEMNNVPYRKSGKTILSNFANVIIKIMKSIAPDAIKNSITENTFDAVMNLLTHKNISNNPVFVSKIKETKVDKNAKSLLNDNTLGDSSNDIRIGDSINLQPLTLTEILKIKTC